MGHQFQTAVSKDFRKSWRHPLGKTYYNCCYCKTEFTEKSKALSCSKDCYWELMPRRIRMLYSHIFLDSFHDRVGYDYDFNGDWEEDLARKVFMCDELNPFTRLTGSYTYNLNKKTSPLGQELNRIYDIANVLLDNNGILSGKRELDEKIFEELFSFMHRFTHWGALDIEDLIMDKAGYSCTAEELQKRYFEDDVYSLSTLFGRISRKFVTIIVGKISGNLGWIPNPDSSIFNHPYEAELTLSILDTSEYGKTFEDWQEADIVSRDGFFKFLDNNFQDYFSDIHGTYDEMIIGLIKASFNFGIPKKFRLLKSKFIQILLRFRESNTSKELKSRVEDILYYSLSAEEVADEYVAWKLFKEAENWYKKKGLLEEAGHIREVYGPY